MIGNTNMKSKSAEQRIKEFLAENPAWFASGDLQRRIWLNKDGTTATPRSIVRRLEEMVEDGILEVEYRGKHAAHYRVRQDHIKKVQKVTPLSNGTVRVEYIPVGSLYE